MRNNLSIQLMLALNSRASCLSRLSAGITGLCYHASLNIYNFKVGLYSILSDLHFQKLLFLPLSQQYIDLVFSTCGSVTFYLNLCLFVWLRGMGLKCLCKRETTLPLQLYPNPTGFFVLFWFLEKQQQNHLCYFIPLSYNHK